MSKKNNKMRGFYGDVSDANDVVNDWFAPIESTPEPQYYQTDVIDNSWVLQEQINNERIAREQAQAEAERAAAEYQRYLNQLEAQMQAEAARQREIEYQIHLEQLEAQREAQIESAKIERIRQEQIAQEIEAQRQLEAYQLALQEENDRKERQRELARVAAEQKAIEIESERVRQYEYQLYLQQLENARIAQEAEDERIRQVELAEAAELERQRQAEIAARAKNEADRIEAENRAIQAERERLAAIEAQIEADRIKSEELFRFKVAQEEKEEMRLLILRNNADANKSEAIKYAKTVYQDSVSLLKAQNEMVIALQKSFLDTIVNF